MPPKSAAIEGGRPLFRRDMNEDTIPLEAGIEDRAISLTKGCYVGQEIIIRVLHRGHGRVARKLVGSTLDPGRRRAGARRTRSVRAARCRRDHERRGVAGARPADRPRLRASRFRAARDRRRNRRHCGLGRRASVCSRDAWSETGVTATATTAAPAKQGR